MASYVAAGVPAQIVRVSNTTLYRVAAEYLGDALYWTRIALINGLSDPWITQLVELKIPVPDNTGSPDGILGSWPIPTAPTPITTIAPQAPVAPPGITLAQLNALLPYLPTTLPDKPGILWSDGGLIAIS